MNQTQQEFTLVLNAEEVNAVLHILGDQPTKLGLWPVVLKIKTQAESQIKVDKQEE